MGWNNWVESCAIMYMWESWYRISAWYKYMFKKDLLLDIWITSGMCLGGNYGFEIWEN